MSMSKDHGVNFGRGHWRLLPAAQPPIFWPLEHAAVDQDLQTLFARNIGPGVDEMF